jgi:hypothetical protein
VPVESWRVDPGETKPRVAVAAEAGHVGDLDAFDELTESIDEASESTPAKLADRYWQCLVPLPDPCAHYRVEQHIAVPCSRADLVSQGRSSRASSRKSCRPPSSAPRARSASTSAASWARAASWSTQAPSIMSSQRPAGAAAGTSL